MIACWCADEQCKIHGCRQIKDVWDKDRFNFSSIKLPVWAEIDYGTEDGYQNVQKEETKVENEPTPDEVIEAAEKREAETMPILVIVDYLLNKGIKVEEIIRRLVEPETY